MEGGREGSRGGEGGEGGDGGQTSLLLLEESWLSFLSLRLFHLK